MGLSENMKGGVLAFAPDRKIYQQGPRLDIAVKAIRRCALEKVAEQPPLVRLAVISFLRDAVLYLQVFGYPVEAGAALTELRRMPDADVGSLSTEAYITRELQAEVKGLNKVTGIKEKMVGFLERSESWRRLKVDMFAVGYERLARKYWDVYSREVKGAADWDSLIREAHARSLRLMPESGQTS